MRGSKIRLPIGEDKRAEEEGFGAKSLLFSWFGEPPKKVSFGGMPRRVSKRMQEKERKKY